MLTRRDGLRVTVAALLLGTAIAAWPVWAQDSGQAGAPRLAIKGYDPVAYFTEGQPTLGAAEFEYAWDEARYRFASDQHMSIFRGDPDRYAPQFAGSCAMGMSKGMKVEADPANWLIVDGRLFVFASPKARERFQADTRGTAAAADSNWQLLKDATFGTSLAQ
jgi:YHS domain-containing protein